MSKVSDLHILSFARTFAIGVWLPNPETSGGTVIGSETVSEASLHEAAERLVSMGLLERVERIKRDAGPRSNLVSYTLTDAGRAAAREFCGDPALTVDLARTLHSSDLSRVYGDLEIAKSQRELRERGAQTARAALKALGYTFEGTGGWHVLPHVTPAGRLGYVNTTQGIAVETSIRLEPELVEAITVPGQPEGPQASGAAAWASPDAGEARRATAPKGWTQLLVDLRGGADLELGRFRAWVAAWGLATCYESRRGEPGVTYLCPRGEERLVPAEWPMTDERRGELTEIAERHLAAIAANVARLESEDVALDVEKALAKPFGDQPVAFASRGIDAPRFPIRDTRAAHDSLNPLRKRVDGYNADGALMATVSRYTSSHDVVREALRESGISRLALFERSNVGGARIFDVIADALSLVLYRRLEQASKALWEVFVGKADVTSQHTLAHQARLAPIAKELAGQLLAPCAELARSAYAEVLEAYYADGHIEIEPDLIPCDRAEAV